MPTLRQTMHQPTERLHDIDNYLVYDRLFEDAPGRKLVLAVDAENYFHQLSRYRPDVDGFFFEGDIANLAPFCGVGTNLFSGELDSVYTDSGYGMIIAPEGVLSILADPDRISKVLRWCHDHLELGGELIAEVMVHTGNTFEEWPSWRCRWPYGGWGRDGIERKWVETFDPERSVYHGHLEYSRNGETETYPREVRVFAESEFLGLLAEAGFAAAERHDGWEGELSHLAMMFVAKRGMS